MTDRSIALTDTAGLVDGSRLDTHLAALGVDDTRAVGANETRLALALERIDDLCLAVSAAFRLKQFRAKHARESRRPGGCPQ